MLEACDAALLIGDVALLFDHAAAGVQKTDLGLAWQAYTGLPFVYAFWFGRPGLLTLGRHRRAQATPAAAASRTRTTWRAGIFRATRRAPPSAPGTFVIMWISGLPNENWRG